MYVHSAVYADETLLGLEVEYHIYGFTTDPICQVVEVNDDEMILEDMLKDRTFEVPRDAMLDVPLSGSEYTVYWKEHRNGAGHWVRTTPKQDTAQAATAYRHPKEQNEDGEWVTHPDAGYDGHEPTRLVSKSYYVNMDENTRWDIRVARDHEDGDFECIIEDSERFGEDIREIYNGIDVPDDIQGGTRVGWVLVNRAKGKIIRFMINPEYRKGGVTGSRSYVNLDVIDENGPDEQDYEWDEVEYSP